MSRTGSIGVPEAKATVLQLRWTAGSSDGASVVCAKAGARHAVATSPAARRIDIELKILFAISHLPPQTLPDPRWHGYDGSGSFSTVTMAVCTWGDVTSIV